MQFYPETPIYSINPLQSPGELRYLLSCPQVSISKKDLTIKYSFAGKWKNNSEEIKANARDLLIHILDISHLSIRHSHSGEEHILIIPLKTITDLSLLKYDDTLEVPIVVKIFKKENELSEAFQLKCYQTLKFTPISTDLLQQEKNDTTEEKQEEIEENDSSKQPEIENVSVQNNEIQKDNSSEAQEDNLEETVFVHNTTPTDFLQNLLTSLKKKEDEAEEPVNENEEITENNTTTRHTYAGIMAIDFGTTNSVVVVRDPLYAAEDIKESLTKEQYDALFTWLDSWLIQHISASQSTPEDAYINKLINETFNLNTVSGGTFSVDIWQTLQQIPQSTKIQFLETLISQVSSYDETSETWQYISKIIVEMTRGFEQSIYSNTLESQRYFILELDANAGSGPISSILQIISAPNTTNQKRLESETIIEMGVRVHLLMRSAVLREADINQFALAMKRYFGQEQLISLLPAESISAPVSFYPDTLCKLTYTKLMERALEDIQKKSKKQLLQYADHIDTLVVTFPTTYPASLRRRLREMIHDLDVSSIDTHFDEGTASALYYIWREICADPICGVNGLMARCRKDRHGRSYQNILLYDLGGGTTDIALIQLIYEEIPIFEPLDKTEAEGCYFRVTPRLLGATGHRYIGGDLLTLWLFRLVKTKLADRILSLIAQDSIEPPVGSALDNLINSLPDELMEKDGKYKAGALLEWTFAPAQNIKKFEILNHSVINIVIPTIFDTDSSCASNFFSLWDLTEECKKKLGTPIATYAGSGLGREWLDSVTLEQTSIWRIVILMYPWITESLLTSNDFRIVITQEELCKFSDRIILESFSPAVHLALARLRCHGIVDKLDRLILSGLSCNLKVVQQMAKDLFLSNEGLFDFNLSNVVFDPALAKTSVAMGACIGRYLQAMRLDPLHEKTRQMLREGYDQVELVVENLFAHLACRLVYDSLVAMVQIFDHGQELNRKSFVDGKSVARTPMDDLRPVQEKFWIYRLDFEGATPQYLGLINSENIAIQNGFEDFRKFREQYLVGFETDAELFTRAFFIPRGPKNILAVNFLEDTSYRLPASNIVEEDDYGYIVLHNNISTQELFNRRTILPKGTKMVDTIEYPDGTKQRCVISEPLPIRELYDFYIEGIENAVCPEPALISHFYLGDTSAEEVSFSCDETGRVLLLLSTVYDIKIWADIDYVPQKVESQFDPFCGQH